MEAHDSLLDLIGGTPLVRLRRVAKDVPATVLAKLEYLNPGGSSKDRIALGMIEAAEADGTLRPGATIVEPTSGNTGVGLAMVAAQRGYSVVFTCPDKVSPEKIDLLRAYGARVVVCPATAPFDHPDFYRNRARALAAEIPGGLLLDQYSNAANPRTHYGSTGPEVWKQTDGRVTHFVAGVGTGGTLSGTGRYLKEVSSGGVTVVGADPDGSIYTSPALRPYLLEGVGQPTLPASYDPAVPDRLIPVSDAAALEMTRRLAREEGMLVGGSGGMAVAAALDVAAGLGPQDVVVVLVPDSGRGYISKIFNETWMATRGFGTGDGADEGTDAGAGPVLGEVLAGVTARPALPAVTPDDTLASALALLSRHHLPALPVTRATASVRLAEVTGTITARAITEALAADVRVLERPVGELAEPPLPLTGAGQPVAQALALVGGDDTVLVLRDGLVEGVVTRADIAAFLAARAADAPVTGAPVTAAPAAVAPTPNREDDVSE
ncbi:pyridoxal-phosphate dependent enzyme [Streptomyces sp. NPDC101160]|uniref:pyridoxal-phosphate dependent enzyme n=1 Tax=Streptomyces sp. NPDC101160 TaxID=3366118 RepID=UPI0037F60FDC